MPANYNYDPTLPTKKDWVRFHTEDKVTGVMILADEEINANLTSNGWNDGLATCALALASYWANEVRKYKAGSGDIESEWGDREGFYMKLAEKATQGGFPDPTSAPRNTVTLQTAQYASTADTDLL